MVEKQNVPYGMWPSPISAAMLSQRMRVEEARWGGNHTILWLEGRSDRTVLVCQEEGDSPRDLTTDQNVRGSVGYGGGEFDCVGDTVVYADRSGKLFVRSLGKGLPRAITTPYGSAASPAVSPDEKWTAYVFSDGKLDVIALVDTAGTLWPIKLVSGADFYMQPAWHPSGEWLAWVEWNHPNMPWDSTTVKIGKFSANPPQIGDVRTIAGDGIHPFVNPIFSPDGQWLAYVGGRGEWDVLKVVELQTGTERVLLEGDGILLAQPAWVQGTRSIVWSADSQYIYAIQNYAGKASLWKIALDGSGAVQLDTQPYTWITQLSASPDVVDDLLFQATSPDIPDRLIRWQQGKMHILARSDGETIPSAYYSIPQSVDWIAEDGVPVHAIYYPPVHPHCTAAGAPPVIFNIHGGPTSQAVWQFLPATAYFTSRGYGWCEVNYRGSSGYGRNYQRALYGRWGDVDVEDTIGAARALVDQGLADPSRLIIRGSSAGGYTVLNSLVRYPGHFKAGVSLYGVSNLFNLAQDTHKFEEHYNDMLIGVLPEAAGKYHAWSAIFHADQIRDPLAVFQGSIDTVVPPSQSEEMVKVLQRRGVAVIYHVYEGEGHGFRKPETIRDYLQKMERFLQQQVLFAP